jgi:5-methylcytosine-specific restriction protein A
MPYRPLPPCRWPGCSIRSVSSGYCGRHLAAAQQRERERKRAYEAGRPSASARGYGVAWRQRRADYLAAHPHCRCCGAPATDVHHLVPRRAAGGDSWDNLAALCHACHSRITARIEGWHWGRTARPRGGAGG